MSAGIRSPLTFWGVSGYALDVNIIEASTTTVTITESQASIISSTVGAQSVLGMWGPVGISASTSSSDIIECTTDNIVITESQASIITSNIILATPDSLLITKYHSSIIVDTAVTTLTNLYTSMGDNAGGIVLQGSPVANWTQRANVGMGNKLRGDFAPNYWTPTNPAFKALVPWEAATGWFVAWPGTGHTSTNTGINIKSIEVWVQRESTGEWRLENSGNLEIWWPSVGGAVTTRTEVDGSRSFFLSGDKNSGYVSGTPYAVHGATPRFAVIDGDDIRCVYARLEHRLILEDYTGPNDIEDSEIYVDIGADPWPTMSTLVGEYTPMTYAPQILSSRFELVTVESQYIQAATINPPAQETGYPAGERSILRSSFELDLPSPLIPFASGIIDATPDSIIITESQASIYVGEVIAGFKSVLGMWGPIGVSASAGSTIVVGMSDSLSITESQSSIITTIVVPTIIDNISITENQATISIGNTISSIQDTILISESQSSIIAPTIISTFAESVSITESQANIYIGEVTAGFKSVLGMWGPVGVSGSTGSSLVLAIPDSIVVSEVQSDIIHSTVISTIPDSISITESSSTIYLASEIDAIETNIVFTEWPAIVLNGYDILISTNIRVVNITGETATIVGATNIDAIADDILISNIAASIITSTIISTVSDSIVISENQAVVSSARIISASADNLIISENQAGVYLPTIIETTQDSIVISESQTVISSPVIINTDIQGILIQEQQATISIVGNINTIVESITITESQASVILGEVVEANIGNLIITESHASIYNPATINTQSDTIQVTGIQAIYYIPDTLDSPQPLRVILDQPGLKVIL